MEQFAQNVPLINETSLKFWHQTEQKRTFSGADLFLVKVQLMRKNILDAGD